MKQIDEIFGNLSEALKAGMQTPRNYNGNANAYKPSQARFKMKIWYNDGNSRTYYSFDSYRNKNLSITDEWEGMKKLIRLGHVTHVKDVKALVIWASISDKAMTNNANYDFEIFKVSRAGSFDNKNVTFRTDINKNVLLDLNRLSLGTRKINQ
jgi:hypothetical protein